MKANTILKIGASLVAALTTLAAWSFTPSQQPPASTAVPGNLLLALSVEWPTGLQTSYTTPNYNELLAYEGYFDSRKCYRYNAAAEVFEPAGAGTATRGCTNAAWWNGNLLNWLTMTNLDQFRSVLTGGTRDTVSAVRATPSGDSVTSTVLIRSFADRDPGGGITPQKQLAAGTAGMPLGGNRFVRTAGYGTKIIVSTDNAFPNVPNLAGQQQSCAQYAGALAPSDTCMNVRVRVCESVGGVGLEPNCRAAYVNPANGATIAKPEGLIQQYALTLRFGSVAYLNDRTDTRNGAVLRSAMKSVGPAAATATGVENNGAVEWNVTTGVMFANPDPADALATAAAANIRPEDVPNSGLMNYLNKFGYTRGYIGRDPVSELMYAAQLYLRGRPFPAEFTNALTTSQVDAFPVITGAAHQRGGSRDPIINTCQKNFVLAIGDIYTHCDGNLPGSTKTGCTAGTPADPDGLNVQNLWNTTRAMEGNMPDARSNTGVGGWAGGAGFPDINYTTPYVAGLAHWANTNDIRSDLTGTQTISTYFVDVLENGNGVGGLPNAATLRTQFWLAAKYGGFDTAVANGSNPNTASASWANSNGVPKTWFPGNSPTLLREGLRQAFASIQSRASQNSSSSAAVTSSRQTSTSLVISAGYNPSNWSGLVRACLSSQTSAQCEANPVWEASRWFKTNTPTFVVNPLTANTRKIFTSWRDTNSFTRMPFQWGNLNTAQQTILQASDGLGAARLAYLRGNRTNEGSIFRTRPDTLLGDIVNAGVTYLAGPGPALDGPNFPGHSAYRAQQRNRPAVVYAASNDGMLHAFDATEVPGVSGGRELFGYIPSAVFNKLPGLTALNFQHQFLVDSTPMVGDFQPTPTTWGTMLVGGLGAGGRGYYALNITNQTGFATANEAALSALPMWEFTSQQDADLGFTFNEPSTTSVTGAYRQIAKVADATTASGVWRVIVGNGYGSDARRAILFMLDASSGNVATKLDAVAGPNNGLSTPTPVDTDRDGLVDTVYAGDLQGHLHKFQFSRPAGPADADFVRATPGQADAAWRYIGRVFSSGEPITTAPSVGVCSGSNLAITFGSGKLNENSDYSDFSRRGFYAVFDNRRSSDLTVPTTDLATINLNNTTTAGRTVRTWDRPNLVGRQGWKMFFNNGERVLSNSVFPPDSGTVLFGTSRPSGNVCEPGDSGFIMAVNLCSGSIGNLLVAGQEVGGADVSTSGVVKITPPTECSGPGCLCTGPTCNRIECNQPDCRVSQSKSSAPRGTYSWREILTK